MSLSAESKKNLTTLIRCLALNCCKNLLQNSFVHPHKKRSNANSKVVKNIFLSIQVWGTRWATNLWIITLSRKFQNNPQNTTYDTVFFFNFKLLIFTLTWMIWMFLLWNCVCSQAPKWLRLLFHIENSVLKKMHYSH